MLTMLLPNNEPLATAQPFQVFYRLWAMSFKECGSRTNFARRMKVYFHSEQISSVVSNYHKYLCSLPFIFSFAASTYLILFDFILFFFLMSFFLADSFIFYKMFQLPYHLDLAVQRYLVGSGSIRLETKSCRISYRKLMVKYERT